MWNFRIFKDGDGVHTFRETHYNKKGEVDSWTNPVYPLGVENEGDPVGGLRYDLCGMLLALSKPVLDEVKLTKKAERNAAKTKAKKEKLKKK